MKTYKTKNGKSYTKKQIVEAITYWENRLKQMNESDDVHDKDVHDETKLILDIPNMPPVDVEFEGEWHGVRFAIDLFTDALAHMKAKDPTKYSDVKMHVKH